MVKIKNFLNAKNYDVSVECPMVTKAGGYPESVHISLLPRTWNFTTEEEAVYSEVSEQRLSSNMRMHNGLYVDERTKW